MSSVSVTFLFEHGAFFAKITSLVSAVIYGVVGITTLVSPQDLTHFILATWIITVAIAIIVVEAVHEAAALVLDRIPDLRRLKTRGALYIACGVLMLGSDWRPLGPAAGVGLALSGALWIIVSYMNSQKESATTARIAAANTGLNDSLARATDQGPVDLDLGVNPTAFFRYEDDGAPNVANGNYAQV
eukprot:Gregarina_sp_Poly_1__2064@NODE_1543_length_3881_cov_98_229942_g1018_i0_p4_GENE_NODE_1543_length_3881_cov_98_229942_g1018_i0NODE_1543_length_3881_cov_98_229942_g1018_i0_p4_ORF_typecomplete_len187_score19_66COPI_assoc/PF08507_10/2_1e12DUF4175/PF13779_6/0_28DUF1129/PF06570_11/0_51CrgA/PF06781_12/7_6e02CrgA/PF06781_12/4_2e02CrgA/PF06781_12/1_4TMEM72/PF16054_5/7_8CitMHS/PF03600_16/1_1MscL/PF01741_18/54MscL/PF01741_18/25MscL/PF01741_18/1e03_NODE_1543_length_3881_cov_98_229942_g1018_i023902950